MQITIQGVGVKITEALNDFINDKFRKLERKGELITAVTVTLSVEKLTQIAKADLQVTGSSLHAQATDENMYNAIDALIDKVDRQLVRHKEKLKQE